MTRLITAERVALRKIAAMREEYRRELNCQIVHDSYHGRGFTDSYALAVNGRVVGYASVSGESGKRDVLKEFFVLPDWRGLSRPLLAQAVGTSGATKMEVQTNDPFLSVLFWDFVRNVTTDTILFADAVTTHLAASHTTLRRITKAERSRVFRHTLEPVGDWGIEQAGQIVATGGLMFHYNKPYGDIYMEVAVTHRRQGLGSYLVQELKRIARESDHVPAARCGSDNDPSRLTLQRAGMHPCARILRGEIVL